MTRLDTSELLRQYPPEECIVDGYPRWWSYSVDVQNGGESYRYGPIKDYVRELAGHRCLRCGHPYPPGITATHPNGEWTPCDEQCRHGGPFKWKGQISGEMVVARTRYGRMAPGAEDVHAQWRILTVHHLDEDKGNCRWWNLAALCQRCHLRMQRAVIMDRVYNYEHSAWFKPYAAGFYAWKYEGKDLSREEVEARMDDLLSWELRFRQEAIF